MTLRYSLFLCSALLLFSCKKDEADTTPLPQPVQEYSISPSLTHPPITAYNSDHFICVDPNVTARNKLFVFLPGTTGSPFFYKLIVKKAASMGYHAVGLMYPNSADMYTFSAVNADNSQFGKCRQEIFDGVNSSSGVQVDTDNCIRTRLTQLLAYLAQQYPSGGWAQYLSGGQVLWNRVVLSGHSQGGGHALYISKQVELAAAISFSSLDWNTLLGRSADWVTEPGLTPVSRLYSFNGLRDDLFSYTNVQTQLAEMGLQGPAVSIDSNNPPYSGSHTLTTNDQPNSSLIFPNHNLTVLDSYVPRKAGGAVSDRFDSAWTYLLDL